jgi:CYTH domain-containing protein
MNSQEQSGDRLHLFTPTEIERKFLVTTLPENLNGYDHEQIRQGYLVIGKDGSEARVRDRESAYTMTVKSKGDLSRGEWETAITPEQFETLWPATLGKRVEKVRFTIPSDNGLVIELDIYEGELAGLVSAEVEFNSVENATTFDVPEWLGIEVTEVKAMKNQQLAENGFPEEIFS